MRGYEGLDLEDLSKLCANPGEPDVPPEETVRSALYGAIRFAETLLGAASAGGLRLSRLICTPDGRRWTLALGDHFFKVEILGDGFAVLPLRPAIPALAVRAR